MKRGCDWAPVVMLPAALPEISSCCEPTLNNPLSCCRPADLLSLISVPRFSCLVSFAAVWLVFALLTGIWGLFSQCFLFAFVSPRVGGVDFPYSKILLNQLIGSLKKKKIHVLSL